jgi:radical SAM protein with 4Fe4S-binding SPASM domain
VDACYLLEQDWKDKGLDMRLGWLKGNELDIDPGALQRARSFGVDNKALCRNCLCRFHCAGGCPVTHGQAVTYDDTCLQTRTITIVRLLRQMGEHPLADAFLDDAAALEQAAWQPDDRLVHLEVKNNGS